MPILLPLEKNQSTSKNIDYNQISSTLTGHQQTSIVLRCTTTEEISSIISQLDQKKASGADEISVILLKKIKDLVSPLLSGLINNSYKTGVYPNCLKIAKVIPIYKGGIRSKPGNYRPISLLSIVNKIIEKTLHSRLMSFFEKYNLINKNQFGFRKGHSTAMAISEFYENIIKSYDQGKATCAVLLDLSKAFDSVNHDILLHKLFHYGIRGNAWKLLKSYLQNRKQFVSGNGNFFSGNINVDTGVPQGSVLGPLLFLIHINDLKNSTSMHVLNSADDTLLYNTFSNPNNMENVANRELGNVTQWLKVNHLKLNSSKTKFMVFATKSPLYKSIDIKLTIEGNLEIEKVNEYKYLGLIIDSDLTWKSHVRYLKTKLSKTIGILFKLRHLVPQETLILVFHSLFLSHLQYGILCWARCSPTIIKPLIILMNKAMRCIYFCAPRDHIEKFLVKNNILNVNDMFNMEVAKFMYKYVHGNLPVNFKNYFTKISSVHDHETRAASSNFFQHHVNKTKGMRGLSYLGVKIWSEIPGSIKDSKSISEFINKYKKFLLDNYMESKCMCWC